MRNQAVPFYFSLILAFSLASQIVLTGSLAAAEEPATISIVDNKGLLQALVESVEGAKGTVKVFVTGGDGEAVEGAEIILLNVDTGELLGPAVSRGEGIATFFDVPVGSYKLDFLCGEFSLSSAVITESLPEGETASGPSVDTFSIVNDEGATVGMNELPVGGAANVTLRVVREGDGSVEDIKVRLLELEGDSEVETVAEISSGPFGELKAEDLAAGSYKVEIFDCSAVYELGSVGLVDFPSQGAVCPPSALGQTAASNGMSQLLDSALAEGAEQAELGKDEIPVISILDPEGRVQSLVETTPGSLGTVKVFVVDDLGEGVEGARVALIDTLKQEVFDTRLTKGRGIASFFNVPSGTYQIGLECGQFGLASAEIVASSFVGSEGSAADQLTILDPDGATVAMKELPVGAQGDVLLKFASDDGENASQLTVKMLDVQTSSSGESAKEVVAKAVTDTNGVTTFAGLSAGDYRVEISDCQNRFDLGGTGVFDLPIAGAACATSAASTAILASQLTQVSAAFGVGTTTVAAAGVSTTGVAASVVGGAGLISGGIIARTEDDSSSSGSSNPDPVAPDPTVVSTPPPATVEPTPPPRPNDNPGDDPGENPRPQPTPAPTAPPAPTATPVPTSTATPVPTAAPTPSPTHGTIDPPGQSVPLAPPADPIRAFTP